MNTRQMQTILNDEDVVAKIAAERNKEIKELQEDLEDVHNIMTDVSLLVADGGKKIDRIDGNISNAADNCEEGRQKLQEIDHSQSKRKKLISTIVLVLISAAIIIGGGLLLSNVFGLSGTVGFVVGAAVVAGGLAVLGGICYGAYSLFKFCKSKLTKQPEQPDLENENSKISRPEKTNAAKVKHEASNSQANELKTSLTQKLFQNNEQSLQATAQAAIENIFTGSAPTPR